jgi:hypothetical protein
MLYLTYPKEYNNIKFGPTLPHSITLNNNADGIIDYNAINIIIIIIIIIISIMITIYIYIQLYHKLL